MARKIKGYVVCKGCGYKRPITVKPSPTKGLLCNGCGKRRANFVEEK